MIVFFVIFFVIIFIACDVTNGSQNELTIVSIFHDPLFTILTIIFIARPVMYGSQKEAEDVISSSP